MRRDAHAPTAGPPRPCRGCAAAALAAQAPAGAPGDRPRRVAAVRRARLRGHDGRRDSPRGRRLAPQLLSLLLLEGGRRHRHDGRARRGRARGLCGPAGERAAARRHPARAHAGNRDAACGRGRGARDREPAAREPDAAPRDARAPRTARGAPRRADRRADGSRPAPRSDAGAARVPRACAHGHGVERLVRPATTKRRSHDRRPVPAAAGRGRGGATRPQQARACCDDYRDTLCEAARRAVPKLHPQTNTDAIRS